MGLILFLFVIIMFAAIWIGCSVLQYRISRYSTEKAAWKSIGNLFVLMLAPIAAVALSIFLNIKLHLVSDQAGEGYGWAYVLYFMLQFVVVPLKAILLLIIHFVTRRKRNKISFEIQVLTGLPHCRQIFFYLITKIAVWY